MLLCKLDVDAFCEGGAKALIDLESMSQPNNIAINDNVFLKTDPIYRWLNNNGQLVYLNYSSSMHWFYIWLCQTLMETFGKIGECHTAIPTMAPLYSHGPLENYLYQRENQQPIQGQNAAKHFVQLIIPGDEPRLEIIAQHTAFALRNAGHEVQTEVLQSFNSYKLGYMMMSSIAKIIKIAEILDVDPFSQPALDELKKRASTLSSLL